MHMRRGQTHTLAGGRAEAAESLAHPVTAMLLSVTAITRLPSGGSCPIFSLQSSLHRPYQSKKYGAA